MVSSPPWARPFEMIIILISLGTGFRMAYLRHLQGIAQHYFSQIYPLCVAVVLLHSISVSAEETTSDKEKEGLGFFSLPMEIDMDSGATNGDATIYRLMPLYSYPSRKNWKVIHMNLITIADAPGRD